MDGKRRRIKPVIAALTALVVTVGAVSVFSFSSAAYAQHCDGYVGLTFDDGPTTGTPGLLGALEATGLRATMFNTGQAVATYPGLTRRQVQAGMWVGNHSWSHPQMTELSPEEAAWEISQTQKVFRRVLGAAPDLFRPPFGDTDDSVRQVVAWHGLTEVLWDVDSRDWNGASAREIAQAASTLQDGEVIVMHDGHQTTIDAIPLIADDLQSRGLCAGMISPETGRAVAPQ